MKNLVQNGLVMVALLLCLVMGFFINFMFAGFAIAIFMYLIYGITKKAYLVFAFVLLPIIMFNGYSSYYLMVQEPEYTEYNYPVISILDNEAIIYEVRNNNNIRIERIKDSSLVTECKNIGCNYIKVSETKINTPEWVKNNYSKFSLIDIVKSYNNSTIITVSKITDITNTYETK